MPETTSEGTTESAVEAGSATTDATELLLLAVLPFSTVTDRTFLALRSFLAAAAAGTGAALLPAAACTGFLLVAAVVDVVFEAAAAAAAAAAVEAAVEPADLTPLDAPVDEEILLELVVLERVVLGARVVRAAAAAAVVVLALVSEAEARTWLVEAAAVEVGLAEAVVALPVLARILDTLFGLAPCSSFPSSLPAAAAAVSLLVDFFLSGTERDEVALGGLLASLAAGLLAIVVVVSAAEAADVFDVDVDGLSGGLLFGAAGFGGAGAAVFSTEADVSAPLAAAGAGLAGGCCLTCFGALVCIEPPVVSLIRRGKIKI
jgi:hypothetical protein